MNRTLHYLYDPLCGWCYGASRLVAAAAALDDLTLELHGGGLWPRPTSLPDEMRSYIREADGRVGAMNGVPYGDAYLSGLLFDPDLVLESRPVIQAVLATEACGIQPGLAMVEAIHSAHYVDGRHVVRRETIDALAGEIGLDEDTFAAAYAAAPVDTHIAETRRLMAAIGASGFPTFLLEIDGQRYAVPHQQFAGNPAGFADWLAKAGPTAAAS